jgi:hypothetical protein
MDKIKAASNIHFIYGDDIDAQIVMRSLIKSMSKDDRGVLVTDHEAFIWPGYDTRICSIVGTEKVYSHKIDVIAKRMRVDAIFVDGVWDEETLRALVAASCMGIQVYAIIPASSRDQSTRLLHMIYHDVIRYDHREWLSINDVIPEGQVS